ncbi:hypothetical protein HDU90_007617 [Geranomyces variabilis]|nr:hypothetical protein HDU90_007617 [Geranomyces variabilis]
MLECALHHDYDDFSWWVTGGNGIFRVFAFGDHLGSKHGTQLKFPGPVEGAPNEYKDTYIDQFPHAETCRRHFEEALIRRFRAAGSRPDSDNDELFETTDPIAAVESDDEIEEDSVDFMHTNGRPLRTDSNITIGDILSSPEYE